MTKRKEFELPHNIEAEKGALGSALIAPDTAGEFVLERLVATQFHNPAHAIVLEAIRTLSLVGMPVEFITLTSYLRDKKLLDDVGGPGYISQLMTFTPTAANVEQYVELVEEKARLRVLYQIASTALVTIRDGQPESGPVAAAMNDGLASIDPSSKGGHVLPAVVEKVTAKLERAKKGIPVSGEKTEFIWWDHYLGGLVEGGYYGLAARPGLGKSALLEQIVSALLNRDVPVCVFAQDMAPDMLIERMACRLAGVAKWNLDHGRLSGDEIDEVASIVQTLGKSPLRLHCIERMTGDTMISVARREMRKHGVKHFFLDHVQTIHVPSGNDEREAWAQASLLVRRFATANPIAWVSIAHLNREAAKEQAKVHQIRGFDNLLGDVDGLVLLDTNTDPSDLEPGEDWPMDFIVGKNRNGPTGSKPVRFDRRVMQFGMEVPH